MVLKITSSTRQKIEAVYFHIVLVQMKLHRGDEKQLIDLEWPKIYSVISAMRSQF